MLIDIFITLNKQLSDIISYNAFTLYFKIILFKVVMIIINTIKDKLETPTSHSNPFVGVDESGKEWFIKTYLQESGHYDTNALFNELIAFNLAEKIDLPWPKGSIVQLSDNVKNELETSISHVIGYEFIHGMQELSEGHHFDEAQMNDLYGKSIFDNWLLIGDAKPDTCKLVGNKLLFMDAGISLGYNDDSWNEDELSWNSHQLMVESSPYHCGNLSSSEPFTPWMNKIGEIPDEYYQSIVDIIPLDWEVPESYKSKFVEVFSLSRENFIPMMSLCIQCELES